MSKAVRFRSTKRDPRSHVAAEVAPAVGGDFLAGDPAGVADVEATSCRQAVSRSCRSET
jgi:hypothetical protein